MIDAIVWLATLTPPAGATWVFAGLAAVTVLCAWLRRARGGQFIATAVMAVCAVVSISSSNLWIGVFMMGVAMLRAWQGERSFGSGHADSASKAN